MEKNACQNRYQNEQSKQVRLFIWSYRVFFSSFWCVRVCERNHPRTPPNYRMVLSYVPCSNSHQLRTNFLTDLLSSHSHLLTKRYAANEHFRETSERNVDTLNHAIHSNTPFNLSTHMMIFHVMVYVVACK